MRRFSSILMAMVLFLSSMASGGCHAEGKVFEDVAPDAWYSKDIQQAIKMGLMTGRSEEEFAPLETVTGPEILTIAARLHQRHHGGESSLPQSTPWYQSALDYCKENGILGDLEEKLKQINEEYHVDLKSEIGIESSWNRLFTIYILGNAIDKSQLKEINEIERIPDDLNYIKVNYYLGDPIYQICLDDGWKSVYEFYRSGILSGDDRWGTFGWDRSITRAEMAALLVRIEKPQERKTFQLEELPFKIIPLEGGEPIGSYQNGRILFKKSPDKTGKQWYCYLDEDGKIAIPENYYYATEFSEGTAAISQGLDENEEYELYDLIDINGSKLTERPYHGITEPSFGYRISEWYSQYGLITNQGVPILPCVYSDITIISHDLITARDDTGGWRFFNGQGKQINDQVYEDVNFHWPLEAGILPEAMPDANYLPVKLNGKYGYLNQQLETIIPFQYDYAECFYDGIAKVDDSKYITQTQQLWSPYNKLTEEGYSLERYARGCAVLKYEPNEWYTIIYQSGKLALDQAYPQVKWLPNGVCCATENTTVYYDTNFNPTDRITAAMGKSKERIAPYNRYDGINYSCCYVDENLQQVSPYLFVKATEFNEGIAIGISANATYYSPPSGYILKLKMN